MKASLEIQSVNKYLEVVQHLTTILRSNVTAHGHNSAVVANFDQLDYSIITKNDVSFEIQYEITLATRCYLELSGSVRKEGDRALQVVSHALQLYGAET